MRTSMKSAALAAALSLVASLALVAPPTAFAGRSPAPPDGNEVTDVATGLDNPRLLSWSDDGLYVAEAGVGGAGPCLEGPEGTVCLGATGALTRIDRHGSRRVVSGLPSVAGPDGSAAIGPSDVEAYGRRYVATLGLGADPALRDSLGTDGRLLGTLVTGSLGGRWDKGPHGRRSHPGHSGPTLVADLARYEATRDPDADGPDSNPTGLELTRYGVVATDSGGNTLLLIRPNGRISTLAVFPDRLVKAPEGFPPIPGVPAGMMPMDAVPTSVVTGPDGAFYVSQLTGFPFPAGGSTIWRVVPGMPPTQYATGLTNVTDLAWYHGDLYAVQLSDIGLGAEPGLPSGSLQRVDRRGDHEAVASGLTAPYGVALRHGSAYVTTCALCPDSGAVVRIGVH